LQELKVGLVCARQILAPPVSSLVSGTDDEVSLYHTGETHTIGSGAAGAWLAVVQEQVAVFFAHSAAACPTAMFKAAE
jgi:hypothetical protein